MSVMTPYSLSNRRWSDKAAKRAQRQIYPRFFNRDATELEFINPTMLEDAGQSIDRVVRCPVPGLKDALSFTFAERFRKPKYGGYRDVTISERLMGSDRPSEVHNLRSFYYLWGLYSEQTDRIEEALIFSVPAMLQCLVAGSLQYGRGYFKEQDKQFLTIPIQALYDNGLVLFHRKFKKKAANAAQLRKKDELWNISSS